MKGLEVSVLNQSGSQQVLRPTVDSARAAWLPSPQRGSGEGVGGIVWDLVGSVGRCLSARTGDPSAWISVRAQAKLLRAREPRPPRHPPGWSWGREGVSVNSTLSFPAVGRGIPTFKALLMSRHKAFPAP